VLVHGDWVDASDGSPSMRSSQNKASMSPWCRSPKRRLPTM
jgi:hypothetical protein